MSSIVLEYLEQFLLPDLSRIVGEYLAFAGASSQKLSWKLSSTGWVRSLDVGPKYTIGSPARLISGHTNSIHVWDMTTRTSHVLKGHKGWVVALAMLPNNRLASGSLDKTIRIWDLNNVSQAERDLATNSSYVLAQYDVHIRTLLALPDGRLVVGLEDNVIRIWDLNNADHVIASPAERDLTSTTSQVLEGHTGLVCALAALPGNRLASGSSDKTIRIWDLDTKTSYVLEGHTDWILTLAVLPNNRLASGSSDKTIRIWDLNNADHVIASPAERDLTTRTSHMLVGHTGRVNTLGALPDGRLVSGSYDTTIRIWNLGTETSYVLSKCTSRVNALLVLSESDTHTVGARLVIGCGPTICILE